MPLAIHAEYPSTLKLIDDDTATLLGWEPSRGLLQWQDLPVEALNHLVVLLLTNLSSTHMHCISISLG